MGQAAPPSPFTPQSYPSLPPVDGVRFATAEAGIRYEGRTDLMVAVMVPETVAAGVTTRSQTASASVRWCREALGKGGRARILVVNSGNANAFTGTSGHKAVDLTVDAAAAAAGCTRDEVYVSSTGVIGEPLDTGKFTHLLARMAETAEPDAFDAAARAIMTTDTYRKVATRQVDIGGVPVRLNGIAKGAGMIEPNMATMLCYIFTDAAIDQPVLQKLLSGHVETTFNCMTVDSDTSTSDTCLVFATGAAAKAGQSPISQSDDPRLPAFSAALHDVMRDLAIQIARDGEGATKFVTFRVTGARDFESARRIAKSCANSPILKTAIAGEDPNWGRVVMAVGKAGVEIDPARLEIWFGPHRVTENGERAAEYTEATGAAYMKNAELEIAVSVGDGPGQATVWTCDLTHGYVSINADYRS